MMTRKQEVTMKKTLLFTALLLTLSAGAFAELFNSKLSASEREKLNNGEVVIRNIEKVKYACMNEREETKQLLATMKELGPNYTAEIIQIRPYAGNENLRDVIKEALLNIPDYAGIPYFSEHKQEWYNLYDTAEITEQVQDGNKTYIKANLEMSLFGVVPFDIIMEETDSYLYYDMTNIDKMGYHERFTAIKPKNMKSAITVFRDGDNWVLYAIGGVDTYKIFFLKDRVETSLINRIKSFCNYIFTKI